ncbi:MAG: hypothetical protein JNG85_13165 [Spirochaetaceae bacterium]|nr:hypothetical protein [Spirochaetaceae bacterium]
MIIVEDGTGLATAQSYVSVADCTTYHAARGNAAWAAAATDSLREQALVRATQALDGKRFRGVRASAAQALEWPRFDAFDDSLYALEGVPAKLKAATCEAALIELATPGALSPALERGGAVRREKVGAIETEYASGAPAKTVYSVLEGLLRGLVESGSRLRRG